MTSRKLTGYLSIALALSTCSCHVREDGGYTVLSSKQSVEKDPNSYGDRQIIIFTLEHNGVTIKAHCQAFDVTNHCGELRAGENYDLQRDDRLRYLSLTREDNPSWAVLGIDEEQAK
jgi:hypothetical protein